MNDALGVSLPQAGSDLHDDGSSLSAAEGALLFHQGSQRDSFDVFHRIEKQPAKVWIVTFAGVEHMHHVFVVHLRQGSHFADEAFTALVAGLFS